MQEGDATLVCFGFGEFQQGTNLESLSVSCVTSLAKRKILIIHKMRK